MGVSCSGGARIGRGSVIERAYATQSRCFDGYVTVGNSTFASSTSTSMTVGRLS